MSESFTNTRPFASLRSQTSHPHGAKDAKIELSTQEVLRLHNAVVALTQALAPFASIADALIGPGRHPRDGDFVWGASSDDPATRGVTTADISEIADAHSLGLSSTATFKPPDLATIPTAPFPAQDIRDLLNALDLLIEASTHIDRIATNLHVPDEQAQDDRIIWGIADDSGLLRGVMMSHVAFASEVAAMARKG